MSEADGHTPTVVSGTQKGGNRRGRRRQSHTRGKEPCPAWKAGACVKGDKCQFVHDLEHHDVPIGSGVQEAGHALLHREECEKEIARIHQEVRQDEENKRREQLQAEAAQLQREQREQARIADEERIREATRAREAAQQARLSQFEASRNARDAEYVTRMAEIARQESTMTTQHCILGSLVTFGTGLDIQRLITGFECCTVQFKNLPADIGEAEVARIFLDHGIEASRFLIQENRVTNDGRRTVKVITDAVSGQVMSAGLEDAEFRDEKLSFEVGSLNLPGGMGTSGFRDTEVMTISWKAPFTRFVADFGDMETTRRQAQALNGKTFMGRLIKVEVNTLPPGRQNRLFNPNSILISNLNPVVDETSIRLLTGAFNVRRLPPFFLRYSSDSVVIDSLRHHIARLTTGLTSLEEASSPRNKLRGTVTVKARFESWYKAKQARQSLSDGTFPRAMEVNESAFWLHLPEPLQYTLTIPVAQYSAQKNQWDSLIESIKDTDTCNLVVDRRAADFVQIRLLGKVKAAVGALKVRIESLAAGEKLEGWHPSLGYSNNQFVQSLAEETGGFLRADYRQKALRAYGRPSVVDTIRKRVEAELHKLASREWSSILPRQSIGFFIRRKVPALMFCPASVQLNMASRRITVKGEVARHTLKTFIYQALEEAKISAPASASAGQICPVCYDSVTNPLVLGCKHVYCTPCMQHFLISAEEFEKIPLTCVGAEVPADLTRLFEVAFTSYITRNPQSLRYCKTPGCTQIYRAARGGSEIDCTIQCPSCFSSICSRCHEDGHGGLSCKIAQLRRTEDHDHETLSERWMQQQKRCPRCQVPIEKAGGCNHMSCRCGAAVKKTNDHSLSSMGKTLDT